MTTQGAPSNSNKLLEKSQATIAPIPTLVNTSNGTLSITLTPPPAAPVPLVANVVFWVAIVSFFGVLLSLWQAHKRMTKELSASEDRLRTELKASADEATIERNQSREQANLDRQHAADQAHEERITKARREVYLELISEMTKSQVALSLLPTQDIENLDIHSGLTGLITATAKISLLGEMDTVTKSRELLTEIQETLQRVIVLLVPIGSLKDSRKKHELKRDLHQAEWDRLTPIAQDFFVRRIASRETADIANQIKHHHFEVEKHGNALIEAVQGFALAHRAYLEAVMVETKALTLKVDHLIYSMRNELKLTSSLEELQRSSAAQYAAAKASTQKMYASFENPIG